MKGIISIALPILFLAGSSAGPGGEFWETTDYRQWSKKECTKLLDAAFHMQLHLNH